MKSSHELATLGVDVEINVNGLNTFEYLNAIDATIISCPDWVECRLAILPFDKTELLAALPEKGK